MDDRPDGVAPEPGESEKRGPGRPPANIHQLDRAKFLEAIATGKGIDLALRDQDVSYWTYRLIARDDAEFRAEVASARRAADQFLDEVGYLLAQSNPDVLLEVWKRRDQARVMREAKTIRAGERAEDRADRLAKEEADRKDRDKDRALRLHLAEVAAAQREKERQARDDGADKGGDDAIDLDRLTPEEQDQYRALARKLLPDDDEGPG